jgi:hypothetical protein
LGVAYYFTLKINDLSLRPLQKNNIYNPFEPLTPDRIQQLIQLKDYFLVVQRFQWVGLIAGTGFMATYYSDEDAANEHQRHLVNYAGKLVDLRDPLQRDRLLELFEPGSPYVFYINTLKDKDWAEKMTKAYADKIRNYIKSSGTIKVNRDYGIDIDFNLKFGNVIAVIRSGEQQMEVPFYELIK